MSAFAGEQNAEPRSAAITGPILLDRNENPYGPSEKVREAIANALASVQRYPRNEVADFIGRIAALHRVNPEQVIVAAGSTEIIRGACEAFLDRQKALVTAAPTYPEAALQAEALRVQTLSAPLDRRFSHDLPAMLTLANKSSGLVYICNPNNPTGSITPRDEIEVFLTKLPRSTIVLIDEAYHPYARSSGRYASFIDSPVEDDRVIVTRTFSNAYGLAGLRVGYAVTSSRIAKILRMQQLERDINFVALRAATAALMDEEYVVSTAKRARGDRQEFVNEAGLRMLKPIDSQANFVMMNTGVPAGLVIGHFRRNNIALGPFVPEMDRYIRVSFGKPAEMAEFWRVWNLMPRPKGPMSM